MDVFKVNGAFPLGFGDGVHWCGTDDNGDIAAGVGVYVSKTHSEYTQDAGGVMPIDDVVRLNEFLTEWLKKYRDQKGRYHAKK